MSPNEHDREEYLLERDNYPNWSTRTQAVLEEKKLWYLIDTSEATTAQNTKLNAKENLKLATKEQIATLEKAMDEYHEDRIMARSIILKRCADFNLQFIEKLTCPKERWLALAAYHNNNTDTGGKIMNVQKLIVRPHEEYNSVADHIADVRRTEKILNEVCKPTKESKEKPHITIEELAGMALLLNLSTEWETWVTATLALLDNKPALIEDFAPKLLQEERRMRANDEQTQQGLKAKETLKMARTGDAAPTLICSHCKRKYHTAEACWKLHPELTPKCNTCSGPHKTERCRQGEKGKLAKADDKESVVDSDEEDNKTETVLLYSEAVKHSSQQSNKANYITKSQSPTYTYSTHNFYADSGGSSHFSNSKSNMTSIKPTNTTIETANGTMKAQAKGNLQINTKGGQTITLKEVLYCPDLTDNLLSISKLTDENLKVTFTHEGWQAVDNNTNTVLSGPKINNMFILEVEEDCAKMARMEANQDNPSIKSNTQIWHERLGHLHLAGLQKLQRIQAVDGMNIDMDLKVLDCETCLKYKMVTSPFPKDRAKRATRIGELIHTDVCGPMEVNTNQGYRYYVSFTDDHSRYTWIGLIKHKSETTAKIRHLNAFITNHSGRPIGTIRSDEGTEYKNKALDLWCEEQGITRQYSVRYQQAQNGVAERKNRTLLDGVRCMLSDSGFPKSYWGEACRLETMIRNHCLTSGTDLTPYEIWTGKRPDISQFRSFGAYCYAQVPLTTRKKLDAKATKCRYLGPSIDHKGHRLLELSSNRVIDARTVKFLEDYKSKDPQDRKPHELHKSDCESGESTSEEKSRKNAKSEFAPSDKGNSCANVSPRQINKSYPHTKQLQQNTQVHTRSQALNRRIGTPVSSRVPARHPNDENQDQQRTPKAHEDQVTRSTAVVMGTAEHVTKDSAGERALPIVEDIDPSREDGDALREGGVALCNEMVTTSNDGRATSDTDTVSSNSDDESFYDTTSDRGGDGYDYDSSYEQPRDFARVHSENIIDTPRVRHQRRLYNAKKASQVTNSVVNGVYTNYYLVPIPNSPGVKSVRS